MRSFLYAATFVLMSTMATLAQDHDHPMTQIDCKDAPVPFGHYGYQHCTLHKFGAIAELMERTGGNCCDGGEGGECRATVIEWTENGPWANLDGMYCPVTVQKIHYDVSLPGKIFAVVCAGPTVDMFGNRTCPATYCAAAAPGM